MITVCNVLSDDMDVLHLSVTHYNNELGEVVEYEMLDLKTPPPQCLPEMTPLVNIFNSYQAQLGI